MVSIWSKLLCVASEMHCLLKKETEIEGICDLSKHVERANIRVAIACNGHDGLKLVPVAFDCQVLPRDSSTSVKGSCASLLAVG